MKIKNNINTNIYRKKKDRIGVALAAEVREEFRAWCKANKTSAQEFIEKSIIKVIEWDK